MLENEGFDVTIAQGGKAGLEQLKNSAPDIVLTDLKMPGVTGIEILSAVRGSDRAELARDRSDRPPRLHAHTGERHGRAPREPGEIGRDFRPVGAHVLAGQDGIRQPLQRIQAQGIHRKRERLQ